jgi:hypothetical protein
MSVRTVYELRTFYRLEGHSDFVRVRSFDELEKPTAVSAYEGAVTRARHAIDTEQTLLSEAMNEITGTVVRIVVELGSYRTDSGRRFDHKIVGESTDPLTRNDGLREFFDVRPVPAEVGAQA